MHLKLYLSTVSVVIPVVSEIFAQSTQINAAVNVLSNERARIHSCVQQLRSQFAMLDLVRPEDRQEGRQEGRQAGRKEGRQEYLMHTYRASC